MKDAHEIHFHPVSQDAKAIAAADAQIDLGFERPAVAGAEPFQDIIGIRPGVEDARTRRTDEA